MLYIQTHIINSFSIALSSVSQTAKCQCLMPTTKHKRTEGNRLQHRDICVWSECYKNNNNNNTQKRSKGKKKVNRKAKVCSGYVNFIDNQSTFVQAQHLSIYVSAHECVGLLEFCSFLFSNRNRVWSVRGKYNKTKHQIGCKIL